jgi:nitrogen-specific signal transduction histidine kinase
LVIFEIAFKGWGTDGEQAGAVCSRRRPGDFAVERNLRRKYARGRDGDGYRVLIANSAGSAMNTQSRVFEPFFSTKGVGESTGLGLNIVRRIVAGHGGGIRVDSTPG